MVPVSASLGSRSSLGFVLGTCTGPQRGSLHQKSTTLRLPVVAHDTSLRFRHFLCHFLPFHLASLIIERPQAALTLVGKRIMLLSEVARYESNDSPQSPQEDKICNEYGGDQTTPKVCAEVLGTNTR